MGFKLDEAKGIIDETFYKLANEVEGFDDNLEKFNEELCTFCEQLGFKTEEYGYAGAVNNRIIFTIKNENNIDYDIILFSFDASIKNKISYLYLDDKIRSILKHSKDDMFIKLKMYDEHLFDTTLDAKLKEYKQLAADWAKLLKERRTDKKKEEIEKDFEEVQVEKDFSDKPLPIHKRFAKNILSIFKKDSK